VSLAAGGLVGGGGGGGGGVPPAGGGGGGGAGGEPLGPASTVTVAFLVVTLPDASRAVKVTVVVPTGKSDGALFVTVGAGSAMSEALAPASQELSEPEGSPSEKGAVWVTFPGTVRAGGVVSTTRTGNVAEAVLPLASVAVHVTVVVPRAKVEPEGGAHATAIGPGSMASLAVGDVKKTGEPDGLVASTAAGLGTPAIVGAPVSTTLTANVVVAVLPWASVAVQVTVVEPSG
jgi:hypothetical protein